MIDGVLIINKPSNITSRDVVNVASKVLKTKKIGHTGTLDPLATGVLVLCIGRATKIVSILTSNDKEYIAEVTLGLKTDTLDSEGKIIKEEVANISREDIIKALTSLTKTYMQEVPMYSAVKVKGRKLYEYARNNEEVVLPKKEVTIYELNLISDIQYIDNKTIFKIKCKVSKGTYIRALINDIATFLKTVGIMSKLERIRQGKFKTEDSISLADLQNGLFHIIPLNTIFDDYYIIIADDDLEKKILNGQKLNNIYDIDEVIFKNKHNELLALYKSDEDNLLRVDQMFKINK